jgi:predicted N-acyltransferase
MASNKEQVKIRFIASIAEIDSKKWDELARPLPTPLLEWHWLHQLEASGSISAETGWQPCHLTVWSENRLVGAAPLYIKSHSIGEFVFDHIWADIAFKIGVRYYPKLVGMSPVTPIMGYRFLIADDHDQRAMTRLMLSAIDQFCLENDLSGANFLFVDPTWEAELAAAGYVAWRHQSFAWENNNFNNFSEFLGIFKTNQRRNIKRERRRILQQGIVIEPFLGDEIPADFMDPMYRFYSHTNARFGPYGCHFLTPEFFHGIYVNFKKRLFLVAAFDKSNRKKPLAMSMLLVKANQMIGRYWGTNANIKDLHFNVCYYTPIDWAIENDIHHFDPGAGSSHKVRRGFKAVANHSFHRFFDPKMAHLLKKHMASISRLSQNQIDELNAQSPVKRDHAC